jgi:4-diphosphocytidyl-2-C-methyl-D-erythritol kinase
MKNHKASWKKSMNELCLRANAKINLFLEVLDKRPDGYHNIDTIFQSIGLHDTLIFRETRSGIIKLTSDSEELPLDSSNLVYKASELLLKKSGKNYGVEIHINKRIPLGAGLAGGSTDASATLVGLNELWSLGYTTDDLLMLGRRLGADVPFCLVGGTAIGRERGDILTRLNPIPKLYVVIANPGFQVSTAWAYNGLSKLGLTRERKSDNILVDKIQRGDLSDIEGDLFNVFESLVMEEYPEIRELKSLLAQHGVLGVLMTGSGSTVFALIQDISIAEKIQQKARQRVGYCVVTETSDFSIAKI